MWLVLFLLLYMKYIEIDYAAIAFDWQHIQYYYCNSTAINICSIRFGGYIIVTYYGVIDDNNKTKMIVTFLDMYMLLLASSRLVCFDTENVYTYWWMYVGFIDHSDAVNTWMLVYFASYVKIAQRPNQTFAFLLFLEFVAGFLRYKHVFLIWTLRTFHITCKMQQNFNIYHIQKLYEINLILQCWSK